MEILVIHSKSKRNARMVSAFARKLGDKVFDNNGKTDKTETHFASEKVLAKDWINPEEDTAWEDL